MMCMKLDWTTQLGEAFTADQAGVLDAVQRLRKQSVDVGNLTDSDQLKVETETQDGKEVITVEPADPKVVYVPQYDPVAVYAPPPAAIPAPATTTTTGGPGGQGLQHRRDGHHGPAGLRRRPARRRSLRRRLTTTTTTTRTTATAACTTAGVPTIRRRPAPTARPTAAPTGPANGYNRPPNYQNGFNNNTIIVNNQGNDYWNKYGNKPTPYAGNKPGPTAPSPRPGRTVPSWAL